MPESTTTITILHTAHPPTNQLFERFSPIQLYSPLARLRKSTNRRQKLSQSVSHHNDHRYATPSPRIPSLLTRIQTPTATRKWPPLPNLRITSRPTTRPPVPARPPTPFRAPSSPGPPPSCPRPDPRRTPRRWISAGSWGRVRVDRRQ